MRQLGKAALFSVLITTMLWLTGCEDRGPIKLGFVAGLTGRTSDLGIAGRNGVLLAVEEINAQGGINGRQVELVIKDDRQDPEAAKKADQELIALKVSAIIGHMTSQMSIAGQPTINAAKTVMVSPTTSTDLLNDQDDNFFRIYPSSINAAAELAGHARRNLQLNKVLAVYDLGNRAHTESWYTNFTNSFKAQGGAVMEPVTFTSGANFSFYRLAEKIALQNADGVFIVANAIDTAMLCQQLSKLDFNKPIIATEWSGTEDLVYFGGSSVNGLTFFHTINRNDSSPKFLAFTEAFENRFGQKPGFASVHGYDATHLVLEALKINTDPAQLKETILQKKSFSGLQGPLRFTDTGDIQRELFLIMIEDGEFRTQNYP